MTTGVTNLWLLPGDESKLGEAPGAKSPLCSNGAIDVQRSKKIVSTLSYDAYR